MRTIATALGRRKTVKDVEAGEQSPVAIVADAREHLAHLPDIRELAEDLADACEELAGAGINVGLATDTGDVVLDEHGYWRPSGTVRATSVMMRRGSSFTVEQLWAMGIRDASGLLRLARTA